MSDAKKIERTTYKVNSFNDKMFFQAKGEVVTFAGFLAINKTNSSSDTFLPKAKMSEPLNLDNTNLMKFLQNHQRDTMKQV